VSVFLLTLVRSLFLHFVAGPLSAFMKVSWASKLALRHSGTVLPSPPGAGGGAGGGGWAYTLTYSLTVPPYSASSQIPSKHLVKFNDMAWQVREGAEQFVWRDRGVGRVGCVGLSFCLWGFFLVQLAS
jgi:hypothetical protein